VGARTRLVGLVALGLAAGASLHAAGASLHAAGAPELTRAVADWVASLDEDQQGEALFRFDDDERLDLRLAPIGLDGLRRDAMSEAQWQAWLDALGTTLSDAGRRKVETIVSLEREVRMRDAESWLGSWFGRFTHGEQRYFASVYGSPGDGAPWGLRFDGHHLSLDWTVVGDGLSLTPLFLGAEPREVRTGWERAGLRALADEEDRAYALWQALDPDQRAAAELAFEPASGFANASRPLFAGEGARVGPGEPVGLARAAMGADAQARLDALVATYYATFRADLAAARLAAIDAAGRDAIRFAWAGSLRPGDPGYYRVEGPTFRIEFDNTAPEADHVHAILREFEGDFGRDLLAEHYAHAHAPAIAAAAR
jgi:hypothetical protein